MACQLWLLCEQMSSFVHVPPEQGVAQALPPPPPPWELLETTGALLEELLDEEELEELLDDELLDELYDEKLGWE